MNATDRPTMVRSVAATLPDVVTALTNASRVHAVASPTAAQVNAVVPSGVAVSCRSSKMRARTGNAVMLMATPRKSAKAWKGTPIGAEPR